jgi:methanogenic corrinoid protein MtbC1
MTLEDIEKYIAQYDNRLTPTLCLAIAQEAARREREAIAIEVLQGTKMPMQKDVLKIVQTERDRLSVAIWQGGIK